MALADPLLKSVKYLVEEFHSVGQDIHDASPYLEQLCTTIEQCFVKGMKSGSWEVGKNKESERRKKFWMILRSFETDGPMPYTLTSAMNAAVDNKRLKSPDGKLRYMIRHCLAHKSLHVLMEFLMSKMGALRGCYCDSGDSGKKNIRMMAQYGGGTSIVTHNELAEQFRSLLLACSTSLTFNLNLKITYFLDQSWQIPITETMEFVPAKELGIQMVYMEGFAIVTDLKPGSLAAEEDKLGVGDLLVEMNDQVLYPALKSGQHDAVTVWRQCKRRNLPCRLTVVKSKSGATGKIYPPLIGTFKRYQKWMESHYEEQQRKLESQLSEEEAKQRQIQFPTVTEERTPVLEPHAAQEGVGGKYLMQYVGEVSTGCEGGADQIELVIRQGVKKARDKTIMEVEVVISEIAVEVSIVRGRERHPLFKHKYADISSCGKIVTDELHFCYIAGDTFCTISKQFKGYVFRASSLAQARTILNAIYQGFKRTTWFM